MTARWPAGDVPTPAENRELVARAQAGDRVAEGEAVSRNMRLVCKVATRYARRVEADRGRSVDIDDIEQEGAIGLLNAIREYDPARGNEVSTVIVTYARTAIVGHLYGRLQRPARSIDVPIRRDSRLMLADIIPCSTCEAEREAADLRESMEDLERFMGDLDPRERRAIRMRYGHGARRLVDVAAAEGVTKERARQILGRAEYRIRMAVKRAGLIDATPELPGHIVHDRNWRDRKARKRTMT